MNSQIVKDVGGLVYFDPTHTGRPVSPTVTIYANDSARSELVASAAATEDPVNTTLTASASRGDTSITVDDTTGLTAGRSYALADTDGDVEWIRVVRVRGSDAHLAEDLGRSYSVGATLQGNRLSVSISSSIADTVGVGYEAEFRYEVGGQVTLERVFFDEF